MKTILGLLAWLAPLCAIGQVVDTAAVRREVDSLIQVARTLALAGPASFDQALEVNTSAERLALERLGRETAAYGNACFNRGGILHRTGAFQEAEKWYLEAKSIREKVTGKENADYAKNLNSLAMLYQDIGLPDKSEPLYLEAMGIRERVVGKETPEYAWSANGLANAYIMMGKYDKAEVLHLETMRIREKILGRENIDFAASLFNLANLYWTLGKYEQSEPWFLEAKNICEKKLGKENSTYSLLINNLARLYASTGRLNEAEALFAESCKIKKNILGSDHPEYARGVDNLALIARMMGNLDKAKSLHLEAKSIRERVLGKENMDYARNLSNLADVYYYAKDFDKAASVYLESKTIFEHLLDTENPGYAQCLNNLANTYLEMGDYGKAEAIHLEAKSIREKVLGRIHPDFAETLNSLAILYRTTGDYEKAESLFLEAQAIREKSVGKEAPVYSETTKNLGLLYWAMGQPEKAEHLLTETSHLNQMAIVRASSHLSEGELNHYLSIFSESQNEVFSFAQVSAKQNLSSSQTGYNNALFYKGFLLQSANQVKRLALSDSVTTENFNLLKSYQRRLAAEYAKPIVERDSTNVADLEEKANAIEKDLARTVAGYGEAMRQVKWQEVKATLKPGEAAVEFVHYRYYTPKATDSTMYAALVLRPGDAQPQFIPLFEEKELTPLLRGASGGNNFLKINALYTAKAAGSKGKPLYELIWQPLENLLSGTKTVYCSSSGLLHRINLAAIPASDGKAFGDSHQLVLLGSTRQLVVPPSVTPSVNSAYLVGGIRYDTDSTAIAYASRGASGSRSIEQPSAMAFQPDSLSATRGGVLDYLPATAAEVREIGQTLAAAGFRAKVDTGFYATEEAFRQLGVGTPSPRIIHLATHGYFFPDPKPDARGEKVRSEIREPVFKMSDHPMIRSGLILAGAKQAWLTGKHPAGLEDGILTAYEISQMNLSGTELVVLSACETGLGDIMGNEGVYGLQRAFKIAGAKYLVMSLWKVDDRSTQEFMTAFYRHWLTDKQPVPQAFRAAQREVRAKHPGAYDWAGFVLIE